MNIQDARWAGMLLARATRIALAENDRIFSRFGLRHKSWLVLYKIAHNPGLSSHALAELCMDSDQAFGQIAEKLEQAGLIERKPAPRRALIHNVTAKGANLLAEAEPLIDEGMRELFSPLTSQEIAQFGEMLQKVVLARGDEPTRNSVLKLASEREKANG